MAFEQYLAQECKSVSSAASAPELENPNNACFDCNICLEYAHDPVVTLCGHLYCWPCIYKWFHFQSASLASDEHPQCPVCKAEISHTTVVPLYGRGQTPTGADLKGKAPHLGMVIPPRPPAFGTQELANTSHSTQQLPYRNPYQSRHHNPHQYEEDNPSPLFNLGGSTAQSGYFHPVVGMFGEMVYARVFGNPESLFPYPPNSYRLMGSSNPRLRRQEMQADKSLSRISFFLFCCFLLCLLFF